MQTEVLLGSIAYPLSYENAYTDQHYQDRYNDDPNTSQARRYSNQATSYASDSSHYTHQEPLHAKLTAYATEWHYGDSQRHHDGDGEQRRQQHQHQHRRQQQQQQQQQKQQLECVYYPEQPHSTEYQNHAYYSARCGPAQQVYDSQQPDTNAYTNRHGMYNMKSTDSDQSTISSTHSDYRTPLSSIDFNADGGQTESQKGASIEIIPTQRNLSDGYNYGRTPSGCVVTTCGGQKVEFFEGVHVPGASSPPSENNSI